MKLRLWLCALGFGVLTLPATAAPHIGMKLACKRYGDAWNSGSKGAVQGVVTGDFAHIWSRVPRDMFADMPRGGKGQVLSSSKGHGSGTVTVATPHGVVTFLLVGRGFNWTVADIYRAGDDGRTVSLKSYLDVVLTSREFMNELKYTGGQSFHNKVSGQFRSSFASISPDELNRIRRFLPEVRTTHKPYVTFQGSQATLKMRVPDGKPHEYVTFKLVRQNGWKVDDYAVNTDRVQIASFRQSMPLIASVQAFGEFVQSPTNADPRRFTADGMLRDSLLLAQAESPFPLQRAGAHDRFAVQSNCRCVEITYPDRKVRMTVCREGGRNVIERIQVQMGDKWADLGHMLSLRQSIKSLSLGNALAARPSMPRKLDAGVLAGEPAAPAGQLATKDDGTAATADLAFAKAEEPEVASPAQSTATAKPAMAAPSTPSATSTANVARVDHQVRPVTYTTNYSMSKKEYRKMRRAARRCR